MGRWTEKLFSKPRAAGVSPSHSQKSGQTPRGRFGIRRLEAFPLSFPHRGKVKSTT